MTNFEKLNINTSFLIIIGVVVFYLDKSFKGNLRFISTASLTVLSSLLYSSDGYAMDAPNTPLKKNSVVPEAISPPLYLCPAEAMGDTSLLLLQAPLPSFQKEIQVEIKAPPPFHSS